MKKFKNWIFVNICIFSSLSAISQSIDDNNSIEKSLKIDQVSYIIKPISMNDRVNLDITFKFKGSKSGVTQISLPIDKYGTEKIYESVSVFKVKNCQVTTVFKKPFLRNIYHKPNEIIEVNYTISYDPEMSSTSNFSPIVEKEMFHFFGPQWTLHFENDFAIHNYTVEFKDVPESWIAFTNLQKSETKYHTTCKQEEFEPILVGGIYKHNRIEINNKPIDVLIDYHFKDINLLEDVKNLMNVQRSFFNFEANPHYLVVVTKRNKILAGTAIENAFICLIRENAPKFKVLNLIAHETMHNWVPLMADIYRDENVLGSEFETEFFNEGFIQYAPKVLLNNEGLMSKDQVVELLNTTLLKYADNAHSLITLKEMKDAVSEKTFNYLHEKVAYYRGDLMAFEWDNIIRNKTANKETILHFIKKVITKAIENDGIIAFNDFDEIAASYDIDAKTDWENYINQGQQIQIKNLGWLSNNYKFEIIDETIFSRGFAPKWVGQKRITSSVFENSNAYKAGLRNGMTIREYSKTKEKNQPFEIIVSDKDKDQKIIYYPSKRIKYQKIVKK